MTRAFPAPLFATVARWLALALLLLCGAAASAQALRFPEHRGRWVVDEASILSDATEQALSRRLFDFQQQTQRQVVVATVPSLNDQPINDYAYQLGRVWGIGDARRDDGILLLVAPNERKVRIEVGDGLQPILTDALSARIIRDAITPRFKAGDFDGGVTAGVDRILAQLQLPPEQAREIAAQSQAAADNGDGGIPIGWIIFIVIVVLIIVMSNRRNRGRGYRSGWGGPPVIIWGGSPWGGGGFGGGGFGGGGGGGGFGGFSGGGGGFSGGGASGGW